MPLTVVKGKLHDPVAGAVLGMLRRLRGKTQDVTARHVGILVPHLSKFENGQEGLELQEFFELLSFLGVTEDLVQVLSDMVKEQV